MGAKVRQPFHWKCVGVQETFSRPPALASTAFVSFSTSPSKSVPWHWFPQPLAGTSKSFLPPLRRNLPPQSVHSSQGLFDATYGKRSSTGRLSGNASLTRRLIG